MDRRPKSSKERKQADPPELIRDEKSNRMYRRDKFLGRGGFARCWEFIDTTDNSIWAGKVVEKASLTKPNQKAKMKQEIVIHRSLKHENVVGFHGYFDDPYFVYIILEMCSRRSLMELHKRRASVTEPETRYFVRQIATGCQYLHGKGIVHRDLKLANLFLDEYLTVKIGDFGLATWVKDDEKKETLCGTPNYIAPEILTKQGHSFEVDAWSLGCILYTLLVGKPPFETKELNKTYERIKTNSFIIPAHISQPAASCIRDLLQGDPTKRPTMTTLLDHEFFTYFTPDHLPVSCLSTEPRFDHIQQKGAARAPLNPVYPENAPASQGAGLKQRLGDNSQDDYLKTIAKMLHTLVEKSPSLNSDHDFNLDLSEEPGSMPIYWFSRWVDYSDKYGLGYELCDSSHGVLFNDMTRLLQTHDNQNLQYIDRTANEQLFTADQFPETLRKKVDLLTNFRKYMQANLSKMGEHVERRECDSMARLPYLVTWSRTPTAIMLFLSNGTLQTNFFSDHCKMIVCPLMRAVTVVDTNQRFRTFLFSGLEHRGITEDMRARFKYVLSVINNMRSPAATSTSQSPQPQPMVVGDENRRRA